jgi:hypothetical protein
MKLFIELLEQYFREAAQKDGVESRYFEIAGHAVTIQFSGNRWVNEMTSALAHLELRQPSSRKNGLTISMWDGGVEAANPLLRSYLHQIKTWWFTYTFTGKRGELVDIHSDAVSATYDPGIGLLSVVDIDSGRGFYWKSDASAIPYYEACSPFRSLLHSWMRSVGTYFVHGAAIGHPDGGVMLVGKGGSGKSTSALACLQSPLQYAGDDYCLVSANASGGFDAHSLYCTAKLVEMNNLKSFPEIAGNVINSERKEGEKVALSLYELREKLIDHFPLRAILVPVITGQTATRILPSSPQQALMAIAPSTLSQLPSSGRGDLQFLGELTRRVPCYRIMLGTDLQQVPQRISELLSSLGIEAPIGEHVSAKPAVGR